MSKNNESAAIDIKDIITADTNPFTGEAQNIGKFAAKMGWGVFVAQEPESPDNTITIYDSPSSSLTVNPINKKGRYFESSSPIVQVRIRSTDYESAYAKAVEVQDAVANEGSYYTRKFKYSAFYVNNPPFHLGEDSNNRQLLVINITCHRTYILGQESGSPS